MADPSEGRPIVIVLPDGGRPRAEVRQSRPVRGILLEVDEARELGIELLAAADELEGECKRCSAIECACLLRALVHRVHHAREGS